MSGPSLRSRTARSTAFPSWMRPAATFLAQRWCQEPEAGICRSCTLGVFFKLPCQRASAIQPRCSFQKDSSKGPLLPKQRESRLLLSLSQKVSCLSLRARQSRATGSTCKARVVVKPNPALNTDAPGLSRHLQGKGRASLRRAGKRERQASQANRHSPSNCHER